MIKLEALYSGKAKTVFKTDNPKKADNGIQDSLTAFGRQEKSEAPKKGYYNARISAKLLRVA